MPQLSQANRLLQVTTPLEADTLLVTAFSGNEQISSLFSFDISLIAENSAQIDFSKIVGNEITLKVTLRSEPVAIQNWRYISGICSNFSEGDRNERFTSFSAEVVPKVWLLTRRARSRVFQQKSVPDILKIVFDGFDCTACLDSTNTGNTAFNTARRISISAAGSWKKKEFIITSNILTVAIK